MAEDIIHICDRVEPAMNIFLAHMEFVPYFEVESFNLAKYQSSNSKEIVLRVEAFCLKIMNAKPVFQNLLEQFKKDKIIFIMKSSVLYYSTMYLQRKLFSRQEDEFQRKIKFLAQFIQVTSILAKENYTFSIHETKLCEDVLKEDEKTKALRYKIIEQVEALALMREEIGSHQKLKDNMDNLIIFSQENQKKANLVLSSSENQHIAAICFSSNLFPFCSEFLEYAKHIDLKHSDQSLCELKTLIVVTCNFFGVKEKAKVEILTTFIYRYIFDNVYMVKPNILRCELDVVNYFSQIKIGQISLPLKFCPKNLDPESLVKDVFVSDQLFSKAVQELNLIQFYCNPLDQLNCVSNCLNFVNEAATFYSDGEFIVFPFEVTFELFFAVFISIDVPEIDRISQFIKEFTPEDSLCPSLAFARMQIISISSFCQDVIKNGWQMLKSSD